MGNIKRLLFAFFAALLLSLCAFAVSSPEIFGDTSIRTEEPLGLRVKAVIDAETASHENTIEYGFLVSRKVLLLGNGLDNYDLAFGCGVRFDKGVAKGMVNGESVDRFFDKTDTELYFAGHFYGISPKYYTDIIVVRPYIFSIEGVTYGEPVEMSIYGVAGDIYRNKDIFESLPEEQQKALLSVIVAVEGEPYEINSNDLRIVISTVVKKNANPTYSVYYDLYNPFNGEYLYGIKGRKSSKDYDEIASMLLDGGKIVPVYDGVVQDTTDGYIAGNLSEFSPVWISSFDGETLVVSPYDASLSCKECIKKHVTGNSVKISADTDTYVTVFDGNYGGLEFTCSDMTKVAEKDKTLLCYNGEVYSDYVKAYVSTHENNCEYIIVIANGEENISDEKCLMHTAFDVKFYADGSVYEEQSVLYGTFATIPVPPEKDGYTFLGWSYAQDGEIAEIGSAAITENTSFYAVFEKNPVYYTVTFTVNGEEYASYQVLENDYSDVPENPALDGYEFLGWAKAENGDVVNPENICVNADAVYYAVFEKLIVYYNVTFMFNGSVLARSSVLSGETAAAPETTPQTAEGYKFMGWSLKDDNDRMGIVDVSASEITEDTVFYSVIITNPNSEEFLEKLTRGYTQLKGIKRSTGLTKEVLKLLTECISSVLVDADNFIYVDKVYVGLTYEETVARAKQIVNEEMSSSEKSQFVNLITKTVDQDVQDFLYEYFDISTKI